jgi:hypothetical protein
LPPSSPGFPSLNVLRLVDCGWSLTGIDENRFQNLLGRDAEEMRKPEDVMDRGSCNPSEFPALDRPGFDADEIGGLTLSAEDSRSPLPVQTIHCHPIHSRMIPGHL